MMAVVVVGFVDPTDRVDVTRPGGRTVLVYSRDNRVRAVVGISAAARVIRLRTAIAEGAAAEAVVAELRD